MNKEETKALGKHKDSKAAYMGAYGAFKKGDLARLDNKTNRKQRTL